MLPYPDAVTIDRKQAPTGPRSEFGQQTEPGYTTIYAGAGDVQDFPLSIAVETSGDADLKHLARVFLVEPFDALSIAVGDRVRATYGATGRQRTGEVFEIEALTTAVITRWLP